jgi:hypothetical protein
MFQDLFLRRLYRTFGDWGDTNLQAGLAVVTLAHQQGLLKLPVLEDRSILILLLFCPPGTALHQAAQRECDDPRRAFRSADCTPLVEDLSAPRHHDLLLLHRRASPAQQAIVWQRLRPWYVPALATFLSRLYLDDPAQRAPFADGFFAALLPAYASAPLNNIEFSSYLYQRLLNIPNAPAPANRLPSSPHPAWWSALEAEERQFLDGCLRCLDLGDRIRLYLSFFANLTSREIHGIHSQGWTRQDTVARLRDGYLRVIQMF